jgi:transcriptional regulator with XRE-family HTH domain
MSAWRLQLKQWTDTQADEVGKRIRAARRDRGMTLETLSEALGVTKATVGHWETGARTIKLHDLAALCIVLETGADQIIFGAVRWPFPRIGFDAVTDLEPVELAQLEAGLLVLADQIGIDIRADAERPQDPAHVTPGQDLMRRLDSMPAGARKEALYARLQLAVQHAEREDEPTPPPVPPPTVLPFGQTRKRRGRSRAEP